PSLFKVYAATRIAKKRFRESIEDLHAAHAHYLGKCGGGPSMAHRGRPSAQAHQSQLWDRRFYRRPETQGVPHRGSRFGPVEDERKRRAAHASICIGGNLRTPEEIK